MRTAAGDAGQCRDREGHRDAVVARRPDRRPRAGRPAAHDASRRAAPPRRTPIACRFCDDEGDAVRLLDAQLGGVAQLAACPSAAAIATASSGSSSMRSATRAPPISDRPAAAAAADDEVARPARVPASSAAGVDLDVGAHLAQHVDDRRCGDGLRPTSRSSDRARRGGARRPPARPRPTRCRRGRQMSRAAKPDRSVDASSSGRRGRPGRPASRACRSVWSRVGPGDRDAWSRRRRRAPRA